jgi:hypothetical protein
MSTTGIRIEVECIADEHGERLPWRFFFGGREVTVVEVLDRWPSEARRYFKLRGDDEGIYMLCNDVEQGDWELTLFDSGRLESTRLSST